MNKCGVFSRGLGVWVFIKQCCAAVLAYTHTVWASVCAHKPHLFICFVVFAVVSNLLARRYDKYWLFLVDFYDTFFIITLFPFVLLLMLLRYFGIVRDEISGDDTFSGENREHKKYGPYWYGLIPRRSGVVKIGPQLPKCVDRIG